MQHLFCLRVAFWHYFTDLEAIQWHRMAVFEYFQEKLLCALDGRVFEPKINLTFRFLAAYIHRSIFGNHLVDAKRIEIWCLLSSIFTWLTQKIAKSHNLFIFFRNLVILPLLLLSCFLLIRIFNKFSAFCQKIRRSKYILEVIFAGRVQGMYFQLILRKLRKSQVDRWRQRKLRLFNTELIILESKFRLNNNRFRCKLNTWSFMTIDFI